MKKIMSLASVVFLIIGCVPITPTASTTQPSVPSTTQPAPQAAIIFGDVVSAYDFAENAWPLISIFLPVQDQTVGNAVFAITDAVYARVVAAQASGTSPAQQDLAALQAAVQQIAPLITKGQTTKTTAVVVKAAKAKATTKPAP